MPHHLCFVLYPGFQILDASGPIAAFEMASQFAPGGYRLSLVSADGGTVPSSSGVVLLARRFEEVDEVDTLIVVGGDGVVAAAGCTRIRRFLEETSPLAKRVASVCSGAYLLASAGLLDGKKATTHWRRSRDFRARFPAVQLDDDKIYINDGRFWTSAGISAGIDLSLALIAQEHGEGLARQVARQLVVYYRRPGGQSQYSALLEMTNGEGRFTELLEFIRSNLDKPLGVPDLAERACMSPRHFARIFAAEVGTTPARAVERLRVEAASAALESGSCSVQAAARQYGFSDAERMRRAFLRLKGIPPSALRRHFGSRDRPGKGPEHAD